MAEMMLFKILFIAAVWFMLGENAWRISKKLNEEVNPALAVLAWPLLVVWMARKHG